MKTIAISVCALFSILTCVSQTNAHAEFLKQREQINKAEFNLYFRKDYPEALRTYKKILAEDSTFFSTDIIDAALGAKDTLSALQYLERAISEGSRLNYLDYYTNRLGKQNFKLLFDKSASLYNAYFEKMINGKANIDIDTYIEIQKMIAIDQYFYSNIQPYISKDQLDSVERHIISQNLFRLKHLVESKGVSPAFGGIILYHIYFLENKSYFEFFDKKLHELIFTKKMNPVPYCQWHDRQRIQVYKMKAQLYGEWNDEAKAGEFYPIEDIDNIDKRRAEIGLCSLKDYALIRNLKLPKEYKPTKK